MRVAPHRPSKVALPGPFCEERARPRSAGPRSRTGSANCSGVTSSARSIAALEIAADDPLGRRVGLGRPARRGGRRTASPSRARVRRRRTRLTTPQRSSIVGVVEPAGHHELARPRRARRARPSAGSRRRRASARRPPRPGRTSTTRSAQIMSQPSATSSPAVRQRPWTSASVGISSASSRCTPSISGPASSLARLAAPASTIRWKRVHVDAAGEDVALGAPDQRPRVRSPRPRRGTSISSSKASSVNRLSGGFESTIEATAPSRSSVIVGSAISSLAPDLGRDARRSRPGRRRAGSTAASADRRRSAGSRAGGSGRRSARRPRRQALRTLKPSGSSVSSIRSRQPPGGDHRVLEVLVGDLEQVGGVRRAGSPARARGSPG